LAGAKRFQDWMDQEEIRMKNEPEIIMEEKHFTKPFFKERPKIDRQLRLF